MSGSLAPELDFRQSRALLWVLLGLLVVLAGVRFSDGGASLAIARGATVDSPAFSAGNQYVWDSPLRVLLLQALPPSIIWIAVVFAVFAVLPAGGLLSRDARTMWLGVVTVFLTPALKISIQNIGVGDGLEILAVFLGVSARDRRVLALALFVIALWHPQQSLFIGVSFMVASYCYSDQWNNDVMRGMVLAVLVPLIAGLAVFVAWKWHLGVAYAGREAFMMNNLHLFFHRSAVAYALVGIPILAWLALVAPRPRRGPMLLGGWILVLVCVSLLTIEVSRVMALISLPIVLVGAAELADRGASVHRSRIVALALLIGLLPQYSWSGVDFFLWGDLLGDLCKWGGHCR